MMQMNACDVRTAFCWPAALSFNEELWLSFKTDAGVDSGIK